MGKFPFWATMSLDLDWSFAKINVSVEVGQTTEAQQPFWLAKPLFNMPKNPKKFWKQ